MTNNICANCRHAEVCGWCDSVTQDACDFYECGGDWIKADVLQRLRKRISDLYNTDVTYDNGDYNTMDTPTLDKVLEYFDSEVNT